MLTSKTRLEKIQDIINRTDLSTMSVKWWEKEMDNIMSQIDKWELSDDCVADSEINKLKKKLESLIPRAQIEIEVINKLEKELDVLLKEIKDEEKGKNKKKGNRKKGI
jgi:hypothetical protein